MIFVSEEIFSEFYRYTKIANRSFADKFADI